MLYERERKNDILACKGYPATLFALFLKLYLLTITVESSADEILSILTTYHNIDLKND